MIRKHKRFFYLFFFFSLFLSSGQQISVREFDSIAMATYAGQQEFDYMEHTIQPPSIWERLGWWIQSIIEEIFLNPNTPWLTRILYYMILILVVGAAVFYIVRLRYGGGLSSDARNYTMNVQNLEQIKTTDFDGLIDGALRENNFKLAIRYLYLKSLASLSNKNLIKLKDWKSPYDYERELKSELVPAYKELARLFEYVWYGDFDAKEEDFKRGNELSGQMEQAV